MHYELLYIIPLKYTDEENNNIIKEVEDLLTSHKAKILKSAKLGKRKLAYKIKHISYGFYVAVQFDLENKDNLKAINQEMLIKTNNNILRFQIIATSLTLDESKYEGMFGSKTISSEKTEKNVKVKEVKIEKKKKEEKPEEKKEVKKEDIDKKIEELMDDKMEDLKNQ
ncbi:30S ribosomal protein S6 [Patescibacteria group bacterium]|nr:30S ribosomal protein S6 [Patescibacteria group bacterium]